MDFAKRVYLANLGNSRLLIKSHFYNKMALLSACYFLIFKSNTEIMPVFPTVQSKLPHVGTTIFTIMSQLGADCGAINLSQGFPSFDCSPELTGLIHSYMKKGYNQYAPMAGVPVLREKISKKTQRCYGSFYHPEEEVTVTTGATEAIYTAITTVVGPGDEVIVFEPAYDSYVPAIELSGGVPVYISMA